MTPFFDLDILENYCKKWKLKINYNKTVHTIFTKSPNEAKKNVSIKFGQNIIKKEDNPIYLGVNLDRQLNLTKHIEKLKQKAIKRLNLVKRLASSKWGADKSSLRQMYLGYVRSTLENNLALQNICSNSVLQSLDKVQNEAVKFISGGMKSSPIAACEIDSNIEPLSLRRETNVVEMVERYRRCDKEHPNRKIVDTWSPDDSIKQKYILKVDKILEDKHHLPTNRDSDLPVSKELPPNRVILTPIIRLGLIEEVSKAKSDTLDLQQYGVKTIMFYPDNFHHIYTDGSAFKGTTKAGCGARIEYCNKTCDELSEPCGAHCDNYEAEILAVQFSIQKLSEALKENTNNTSNWVIFLDSLSVLQKLEEQNLTINAIRKLAIEISPLIETFQNDLYLQWIPSHCGIPGNERADTLAKKGASMLQPDRGVSQSTVKKILKSNKTIE